MHGGAMEGPSLVSAFRLYSCSIFYIYIYQACLPPLLTSAELGLTCFKIYPGLTQIGSCTMRIN